jgi:hypothetical protein
LNRGIRLLSFAKSTTFFLVESASRHLLSKAPAASSCGKTDGGNILNETSCAEHLHTIQDARWPVVRKKNFGNEIGRSAPTFVTSKAENVDQSDSSIPLTGSPVELV